MGIFMFKQSKHLYGSALYQYLSTASVAVMVTSSGLHYGWSSPSLEKLQLEDSSIKITNSEGSWLAVMTLIGSILGSVIAGITIDLLGRKRTIMLAGPLFVITWIMIAYAKSIEFLYLARFIAGCVSSLTNISSTMYVAEISAPHIRGLLISSTTVTWIFGILLINIIGSYLSITTTALVCISVPTISFITFFYMPESPYALLMKGDYEGAKSSLQVYRGLKDVESELGRINSAINSQKTTQAGKYLDLVTVKSNRRALFVALVLRSAQIFSGSSAITLYTQTIFREAGGSVSPEVASIIYVSLQLIFSTFSTVIVDWAGRRPLVIISICGSALALFIEGTYFFLKSENDVNIENFSYISLVALLVYIIIFSVGMQTVPTIILGELFPANVKAFALCMVDLYLCFAAIASSKFFQIMKDHYGMYVPFYAFTGICLIGLVFIYIVVPETKGKTLEQIQVKLSNKNDK